MNNGEQVMMIEQIANSGLYYYLMALLIFDLFSWLTTQHL
ncbi:hypothetical protein ERHA54_50370 (plasmid) [Erwinia rhapontici]|nr:hypothetical protein ERHA54_50370 [Erwinia rhapontici]